MPALHCVKARHDARPLRGRSTCPRPRSARPRSPQHESTPRTRLDSHLSALSAWQTSSPAPVAPARGSRLLRVEHVLIENVPEFQSWAPLDARGRPLKSKRGQVYQAFLGAIKAMNYHVETRVLNAADFGEATTRRRLFIQAARRRRKIAWPEPSHSRRGHPSLLRSTQPWRPARDIIDWSLPSRSIFDRNRPLSKNTLRRIEAGLRRFGGRPFVLGQQGGGAPRQTDQPLPTVTADGAISVVEPFLVEYHGERGDEPPRFRDLSSPLPTLTTENRFALAEPFLVPMYGERSGQEPLTHSITEPVPTIPASGGGKFGLVTVDGRPTADGLGPATHQCKRCGHWLWSKHEKCPTCLEPFVVQVTHGGRTHGINEPLPTITGGQRGDLALIEPFTLPYCSNGGELARPVSQPVGTITTRDRFALVIPDGMDVRFRMLQPHELAAAMGFPSGYEFVGTKSDTIRMIGNAWSCRVAEALCSAILNSYIDRHALSGQHVRTA
jgi:DNA (cytosine-5)-methyltransferase 1